MKTFYLLLFSLLFGQIFRIEPFSGIVLYLHDFIILIFLFKFVFRQKPDLPQIVNDPISRNILLFCGVGIFALIISPLKLSAKEILYAVLYPLRFLFYASLFWSLKDVFKNKKDFTLVDAGLILFGVLFGFFGVLQLLWYPDVRNISYLGWDPHYGRMVSTLLDANFTGIVYALFAILAYQFFGWNKDKNMRIFYLLSFVFLTVCLILTFSRSSYLAFVLGLGLHSFFFGNRKYYLIIVAVLLLAVFFVPKPKGEGGDLARSASVSARTVNFQRYLPLVLGSPITGFGFNSLKALNIKYGFLPKENIDFNHAGTGVDNSVLFVLLTSGFIGLFFYINMLRSVYRRVVKIEQKKALLSIFAAVFIHAMFQNTLFYAWIMILLWIISVRMERSI